MPLPLPTPAMPGLAATAPASSADAAPLSVLLLGDADVAATVQSLLQSSPGRARLSQASSLGEALIAAALCPPALSVIDGAFCEALEREFVDHLLRADARTQVLLLGSDTPAPRPPHPRLTPVPPHGLRAAIAHWLDSRASAPGAAA